MVLERAGSDIEFETLSGRASACRSVQASGPGVLVNGAVAAATAWDALPAFLRAEL